MTDGHEDVLGTLLRNLRAPRSSSSQGGDEDGRTMGGSQTTATSLTASSRGSTRPSVAPASTPAAVEEEEELDEERAYRTGQGSECGGGGGGGGGELAIVGANRGVDEAAAAMARGGPYRYPAFTEATRTALARLDALCEQTVDDTMSEDDLIDSLNYWFDVWCPEDLPEEWFSDYLVELLGPVRTENALVGRHRMMVRQLTNLRREMTTLGLLHTGPECAEERTQLMCIFSNMSDILDVALKKQRVLAMRTPRLRVALPKDETMFRYYMPQNSEKHTPYQKLLLFYLDCCEKGKLAKVVDGQCLYRPCYSDGETGYFTYSYTPDLEFETFIYRSIDSVELHWPQWECLTARGNYARDAITYLKAAYHFQLPFIAKDQHYLAFRNGIYFLLHDRFFHYAVEEDARELAVIFGGSTQRKCPAKFHPYLFPNDEYNAAIEAADGSFMGVPTPVMEEIFDSQGFSFEVRMWIYILLGRMLLPVGECDNWQVQLYLKGMAGTGKSTLVRNLCRVFETVDVGVLGNTIQPQFAVEVIANSFFYVALDINKDFKLDPTMWQSMVSGEEVSISRKFKMALIKVWTSQGILVSNVMLGWSDNGGSLSRRLVMVDFKTVLDQMDPTVPARLRDELPAMVKKIGCGYSVASAQYGKEDFWKVAPPYFHEMRRELQKQTNTLSAFLHAGSQVAMQPNSHMTMDEFRRKFELYCDAHRKEREDLVPDYYSNFFQRNRIYVLETALVPMGSPPNTPALDTLWLINVCDARFRTRTEPEIVADATGRLVEVGGAEPHPSSDTVSAMTTSLVVVGAAPAAPGPSSPGYDETDLAMAEQMADEYDDFMMVGGATLPDGP